MGTNNDPSLAKYIFRKDWSNNDVYVLAHNCGYLIERGTTLTLKLLDEDKAGGKPAYDFCKRHQGQQVIVYESHARWGNEGALRGEMVNKAAGVLDDFWPEWMDCQWVLWEKGDAHT